jgi:hypothetical protein
LESCDKVIITRDMTFNEQETFNGDLAALKDDMLDINLDELSELLQKMRHSKRIGGAGSACLRRN